MRSTLCLVLSAAAACLLGACSSHTHTDANCGHHAPSAVTKATPEQQAKLLDRMKSLAGTWESADDKGAMHTSSIISVTSNGSAVREVMLPGTLHEMTNMYTMDGPNLVMTHYCAMGNQPHMRSVNRAVTNADNMIILGFDGVSNLSAPDQLYMGEMTLTFIDNDHLRTEWRSFKAGVPADHTATFDLTRKN
jgi:hypothetical protein